MIKLIMSFLILTSLSYGCQTQWKYGKSANGCMLVDGQKREFRYFIPTHAKGVILPLIVGLHGGGGNPKRFEKYTKFSELAEKSASFIMVYPKGIDKHWNDGRKKLNAKVDDVKFISSLINIVPRVDKEEVYVTGMSNGGLMAQRLACEIPSKLKGIAVIAATMSQNIAAICQDKEPLNALFIFGDKDSSFIKNGTIVSPLNQHKIRGRHIGINATIAFWKKRNACGDVKIGKKINNFMTNFGKYKDDGTEVYVHNYKACKKKLRFYDVKGGGHRWPDPSANNSFMIKKAMNVGWASHEISSAHEIVWFFGLIKVH